MLNARSTRAQTGAAQPGLARPPNDFLVTDPAATRALLAVERFPGVVWEPACGTGEMAEEIVRQNEVLEVMVSDLVERGYSSPSVDFLQALLPDGVDHIVTNPPYELDEEFVLRALALNPPGKIAMLLRLVWLEGAKRRRLIWDHHPPARVWVFSKRPRFRRNGVGEYQGGLLAFAWFVWDRSHVGPPTIGWL